MQFKNGPIAINFASSATDGENGQQSEILNFDRPIPKPTETLSRFEQILRDPSLARRMHTPDYFLLVE